MATYPPPNFTEPLTVFNPVNWEQATGSDVVIDVAYLDANYLKFPVAQGLETLQQITVNGVADFNNTTTMSKPLTLDGTLDTDRIISNVYYQLKDKNALATTVGQIFASGGTMFYDNDAISGSHQFATTNAGGIQTIPLSISSLNGVSISTNNPLSSSSSLNIADSSSSNQFIVIPNVGGGLYNASVDAGNILILGTSNAISTETVQITTWSATNNYLKVRPTSVGIGAGGAGSVSTTAVECDGTTVRIRPSITFPDNTVQTTAFTGGASTTYTVQYTTTQSITLPNNCIGIGVRCIGQGGTAGVSSDGNAGTWGAGGSGGGGGTVYSMGIIPLYAGTVLQLNFAGYTEILLTTFGSASLCRANIGGNGGNGSGSNGGVAGAGGGSANLNTTYGDWSTKVGSNGIVGGSNLSNGNYALIPSTAGSPVGIIFSDTNFGCGQRWGSAGGINAPQNPPYPPIPKPTGVCYITYYIKN